MNEPTMPATEWAQCPPYRTATAYPDRLMTRPKPSRSSDRLHCFSFRYQPFGCSKESPGATIIKAIGHTAA
jgi:hypothetical protein